METVRCLLTNFANRSVRDNMEQSPEHIARQRMHMDIVELLKDYSLGCTSPKALPSPPLETANSPLAGATSPVDPQAIMSKVPVSVQPKPTNARQGARAKTTEHGNAKKKRKKTPRSEEEAFATAVSCPKTVVSPSTTCYSSPSHGLSPPNGLSPAHGLSPSNGLSPSHGLSPRVLSPCSSGNSFSPSYAHGAHSLSPQGSSGTAAISPANSTTFSPPQPGSLDTQSPSSVLDEAAGLGVFDDGDLDCLEGFDVTSGQFLDLNYFPGELDDSPLDCEDMPDAFPLPYMMPESVVGGRADHLVPNMGMTDCMFQNENQRLYSTQSAPSLRLGAHPVEYAFPDNTGTASATREPCHRPSQIAAYHDIGRTIRPENMFPGRKVADTRQNHRQPMQNHIADKYTSTYVTSFEPANFPLSYLTPSPESESSSSSSSSSPHASRASISC